MTVLNERKSTRLSSIDQLRGFAVLAVVLHHLPFSWRGLSADSSTADAFSPWVTQILHFGLFGVHLFLVISGFCIHLPWARELNVEAKLDFREFWLRRMRRLYPPYLVTLVITAGLLVVGQVVLPHRTHEALAALGYENAWSAAVDFIVLLLLLQNINGASWRIGNGPLWTLALEEQLYALYFPLLAVRRKWGWARAITGIACITFAWRLAGLRWPDIGLPKAWLVLGPARWLEWSLGALAVEAHLGLASVPAWCRRWVTAVIALVAALTLEATMPRFGPSAGLLWGVVGDSVFGFAFFTLVLAMTSSESSGRVQGRVVRWFGAVGVFSYSLYLVHNPLMAAVKRVLVSTGSVSLIVFARLFVALAGGYVFHLLIERRFLNRTKAQPNAERSTAS